ncbi:hypothetical protein T552_01225 [Pneumocystis carinii B80]|uniref:Uncharacterized protein n=1 Tax=Pneumocystis carinii (strain B80) TaxID=1408658 RepID=A0A0W4ZLT5_PNEC8|nr:hypothetical protein T552_01225 [Pneumocystis carinii B80]KTW29270.1 hypothetical protein T552_01225 [Pneumocystis carinii B80]
MLRLALKIILLVFFVNQAISTTNIIIPDIDVSKHGQTVIIGDFAGISLYAYNERGRIHEESNRYKNELFMQVPNKTYISLGAVDGFINVMSIIKDGENIYAVIAGHFSRIGDVNTNSIVFYDLIGSKFVTLKEGILNGYIRSVYYHEKNRHLYVGGSFRYNNSLNAIIWDLSKNEWIELPFRGFNGFVNTISQMDNGNILFGGQFQDAFSCSGGTPFVFTNHDKQVLNLHTATILSEHSTSNEKYANPRNIICSNTHKNNTSWILEESEIGKWFALFRYIIRPQKIRFKNSDVQNYATKIFRVISFPFHGIMNLSYTDPVTKKRAFCEALCPLQQSSLEYQEFDFVNIIPMSGFRIEIIDWYGKGGGLKEVEVLLSDIQTFAVNTFNEPICVNESVRSNSYVTGGPWEVLRINDQSYLSANISTSALERSSVVFEPRLQNSGYYHIHLYTPGCIQDNTCLFRGIVQVKIHYKENVNPRIVIIHQTQNYEKIDNIYQGFISGITPTFRPYVVIIPIQGQRDYINVVALAVKFIPVSIFGSSNGLFEYNPSNYSSISHKQSESESVVDIARSLLSKNAIISSVIHDSSQTIIAGRFFNNEKNPFSNILRITPKVSSLGYGGLNGEIFTMLLYNNIIYIGGRFDRILHFSSDAINNVVSYSITDDSWTSLLWGLNGPVYNIYKYVASVNDTFKTYIAFSGNFTDILSFQNKKLSDANGFALWDPENKKWETNIDLFIDGQIQNSILVSNNVSLVSGNIRTIHSIRALGAVALHFSKSAHSLSPLFYSKSIAPFFNLITKRDIDQSSKNSIYTGVFYKFLSQPLIILGGQFSIENEENELIKNIAVVHNSKISGIDINLDPQSIILSLVIHNNVLYVGGRLYYKASERSINGIVAYNLKEKRSYQLFPLSGDDTGVNILSMRPRSSELIIIGKFNSGKPSSCNGFCIFETSSNELRSSSFGFSGEVTALSWLDEKSVLISGNIKINSTSLNVAKYNFDTSTWSSVLPQKIHLPGPATSIIYNKNDKNSIYFSGRKRNGDAYFNKWNGKILLQLDSELLPGSIINHMRIVSLKQKHRRNNVVPEDIAILVLGSLIFSSFGTVTAAFYDGNAWTPYLISSTLTGQPGIANSLFFEHEIYSLSRKYLAKGYVVLISLSISLSIIFLMTLYKVILTNYRRKKGSLQTPYFPKEKELHKTPLTGISNDSDRDNL